MLTMLALSWARPAYTVNVAYRLKTLMVALDVSLSMEATDVKPFRLRAAQGAASTFVRGLPDEIQVGLVVFSDQALVTVLPTLDRSAVVNSILATKPGGGTAIGEAVFKSLDAITADRNLAPKITNNFVEYPRLRAAAIVLLSDGSTNQGRPNGLAATAARSAGVPVSTIAFGTANGKLGEDEERIAVPVDAEALQVISATTAGHAYRAASAGELSDVYTKLGTEIIHRRHEREVTDWFVGGALVLAGFTAFGSIVWFGRIP
jgi:Ca-activated chloride channel family protein